MSASIKKELALPDGGAIRLYDMSAPSDRVSALEIEQNVYRVDARGHILWRINAKPGVRPKTPFTNIYFDSEGKLKGFRFDCYEHQIDIETGHAEVVDFLK